MPIVSIGDLGAQGVSTGYPSAEIPLNAWTKAKNMHAGLPGMRKVLGGAAITAGSPIKAYAMFPYFGTTGAPGMLLAGDEKVYAVEEDTYHNITRQTLGVDVDYGGLTEQRWTGGLFNGKAVIYNGFDDPQYWDLDKTSKLVPLSGWQAGVSAAVLRPYKNYLVAGNVTKSGTPYSNLVKWSHVAEPGFMPTSWDETDPTKDAGEYPIAETPGAVVDMVTLGQTNIVYKEDSIWKMTYVGGGLIMRFDLVSAQAGLPLKNCAVEYQPGRHLVFTGDDWAVFDGNQLTSILGRFNKKIIGDVFNGNFPNTFSVNVPRQKEVWLCFASAGMAAGMVDQALVWNTETNAITMRELGIYSAIAMGIPPIVGTGAVADTWDTAVGTWTGDDIAWSGGQVVAAAAARELISMKSDQTLLVEEKNDGVAGVAFEAVLEKEGLGIPFNTRQPPDVSSMKFCRRVWPRIYAPPGTVIEITVGSAMRLGDPTVWDTPQAFQVGAQEYIDCLVSGRVFALRFRTQALVSWELLGYDLDVDKVGSY